MKLNKMIVQVALVNMAALATQAQAVAAWDFSASANATSAGWTTFNLGASNSSTVGGLTLTQAATGDFLERTQVPAAIQTNAPVLLAAGPNEMNDGFDLNGTGASQTFTLSGLTSGQTYRLQFIGIVRYTADAQNRNLTMTLDEAGSPTAILLDYTTLLTGDNAGYSEYVEFTVDASQDVVLTFGEVSSGIKCVSGLIVDAIVQPGLYTLTVNGGSGSGSYTNGAQVAIVANAPVQGQYFDRWTGDTQFVASAASATTTVTMPSNAVSLTATYAGDPVSYTLTANAGANGSVTPASTNMVSGGSANFMVTANPGYRIVLLTTNGTPVAGMYYGNTTTNANVAWAKVQSAGTLAATFAAQSTNPRPNLLFIMTDQQRWDTLSLAGNPVLSTPNLDRLGNEGAYFKNFYSTRAICVPARSSILTGCSPHNTKIYGNGDINRTVSQTSFDRILHAQGYYTRYYGKWHTPTNLLWHEDGTTPVYDNPDIGNHDHNVTLVQATPEQTWTYTKVFQAYLSGTDPYGFNKTNVPRSTVENPAQNLYKCTLYQGLYEALPLDENRTPGTEPFGKILVPEEFSHTAFQAKEALWALDAAAVSGKPFAITCSIGAPHPDMVIPDPWFSMFPATNMPVSASIADSYVNQPYTGADAGYNNPATIGQMVQCYYAMVKDVDHWVGQILDKLDALGLAHNTLVIFISDHGEMLGDHGKNSKSIALDGGCRVPGLFRFPAAIPAGTVVETPAAQIDLFPTILDYLGVSAPSYKADGYSVRPLIDGTAGEGDHPDYCVAEERLINADGGRVNNSPMYAVRTAQWKLIVAEDATSTAKDALYDMVNDPDEMNNLIGSSAGQSQYRDVAESMKARLIDYLTHIGSPEVTNIQAREVVPVSPKKEGTLDWSVNNTVVSNSELSLVGVAADGNTKTAAIGGRTCRAKTTPATDQYFYFKSSPTLFYRAPGARIAVECDFYVASPTGIGLSYDSINGPVDHPVQVTASEVGQWKTARWYIEDALFGERMPSGTDFAIRIPAGITGYISRVKVVLPESADWPPFAIAGTKLQWPEASDALGWKLYAADTLDSSVGWSNVAGGIVATNGYRQYTVPETKQTGFFRMKK